MSEQEKKGLVPALRFPEFRKKGEWKQLPIGRKVDLLSGYPFKSAEISENATGIPLMRGINITEGLVRHSKDMDRFFLGDTEELEKYRLRVNDLVIGMDGSKVGKNSALISDNDAGSLLIQRVARLRSACNETISFIFQHVHSNRFHNYVDRINTSGGIPHISAKQINEFEICFPPVEKEQQKIADCLASLDDLITAHTQKLDALKAHKKGLMQQLFPAQGETVPKLRFPEFRDKGEWKTRRLGDFITERSQSLTKDLPLYSLTIEDGVTPKTERYERAFLVKNKAEAYKIVQPDDFAYNPMNLRFGAIAKYSGSENVALSKYYNIFYCDDSVDAGFCEVYFRSYGMITHYDNVAVGSLIEKRRVHFNDFLKFDIRFPLLREQQKIADCLTSMDESITAQREKIEVLKAHKKGLMQRLFPAMNERAHE